ncbi:hypothetical protein GCM10010340_30380 [Streptomyces griseoloalbus]|nr:hypothetical protein GCM10010294_10980 [Streptomyces griseoloalbus]GGW50059.1 hypothetical protein GCM10010340_30380 [Streptomyces albaduncus]
MRGLAAAERFDHLAQQPSGPAEQFLVTGDVVEPQHGSAVQNLRQLSGERRLPGAGVSVDTDEPDRAAGRAEPADTGGEIVNGWFPGCSELTQAL